MNPETEVVKALLAAAHIPASDSDIVEATKSYRAQRRLVESLYAVVDARYCDPALTFATRPPAVEWHADDDGSVPAQTGST